jgi:hypothetical protein
MNTKKILGGAAIVASAVSLGGVPAAVASTSLPKVRVRVEGLNRTLLRSKLVTPNGKRVRRDGHSCKGNTGIDPFNLATRGHWSGPWFSGLGWQPTRILGEHDDFTKTGSWFELFVNNKAATVGLCSLKLERGQRILMAAVPAQGTEFPSGIHAPKIVRAHLSFTVTVVRYDANGKAHPLGGATVRGGGLHATTDAKGQATLVAANSGRLVLTASHKGEIRSEAVLTVRL